MKERKLEMKKYDMPIEGVLGVIWGKILEPKAIKRVVNSLMGNKPRHIPTTKEMKICREIIKEKYDWNDKRLIKERIDLEEKLKGVNSEEEVKNILKNWIEMVKEKKIIEKKRKYFEPPY